MKRYPLILISLIASVVMLAIGALRLYEKGGEQRGQQAELFYGLSVMARQAPARQVACGVELLRRPVEESTPAARPEAAVAERSLPIKTGGGAEGTEHQTVEASEAAWWRWANAFNFEVLNGPQQAGAQAQVASVAGTGLLPRRVGIMGGEPAEGPAKR